MHGTATHGCSLSCLAEMACSRPHHQAITAAPLSSALVRSISISRISQPKCPLWEPATVKHPYHELY